MSNTPSAGTAWTASGPPTPADSARTLRIVGLVVVLVLIGLGAASVVVQFFEQRAAVTETVGSPVTRLVTDTGTGDTRIRVGRPGEPVRITSTLHWAVHRPRATWTVADGVLTVTGRCAGGFQFGTCSVDLDITVPPATAVDLTTSTGDIRGAGLTGTLVASTRTGDVGFTAVGSPRITAHATTGDVTIVSTGNAPAVEVGTTTGDVQLEFTSAPTSVRAAAHTGDVTVTLPRGRPYQVTDQTNTGDTTVEVARDPVSTYRIDARTTTGDIRILNR